MSPDATPPTDEQIVERIKSGDTEIFEVLYDRYYPYLIKIFKDRLWLIKNTSSGMSWIDVDNDSEDLTYDVIVKVFSGLSRFNPSRASFKTWLVAIAHNHCSDWLARKRFISDRVSGDEKEGASSDEDVMPESSDLYEDYFLKQAINDVLEVLSGIENELLKSYLVCKFIFAMPDKEIAALYDISETSVRSNICRALKVFTDDFVSKKTQYRGIDLEELANAIREGAIHIDENQVKNISDESVREAIENLFIDRMSVEEFLEGKNISREDVERLVKSGISEMLAVGLRRGVREMKITDDEFSDKDARFITGYIDAVLSHRRLSVTRATKISAKFLKLKSSIDLLTAVSCALVSVKMGKIYSTGAMLQSAARKRGISLDKLAAILQLDISRLSEVLNDRFSDEIKSDKALLKRISRVLEISPLETEKLMNFSSSTAHNLPFSRGFKLVNPENYLKAKSKISEFLARKYRE